MLSLSFGEMLFHFFINWPFVFIRLISFTSTWDKIVIKLSAGLGEKVSSAKTGPYRRSAAVIQNRIELTVVEIPLKDLHWLKDEFLKEEAQP